MENEFLLILCFLASFGLGLYRSGVCREKPFVENLVKPFIHLIAGSLGFWILGSGFASNSDNVGIGTENFFLHRNVTSYEFYQVKIIVEIVDKENLMAKKTCEMK